MEDYDDTPGDFNKDDEPVEEFLEEFLEEFVQHFETTETLENSMRLVWIKVTNNFEMCIDYFQTC